MSNIDYIKRGIDEMLSMTSKIKIEEIDEAVELLLDAYKNKKHVFSVGNGGGQHQLRLILQPI